MLSTGGDLSRLPVHVLHKGMESLGSPSSARLETFKSSINGSKPHILHFYKLIYFTTLVQGLVEHTLPILLG